MCLYVPSPPPGHAPCLSSPLLLRGYCRGKKQTSSYTAFHQGWNLPEFYEQESTQWQALACEVWGGVPETCATSHIPPGRTSPTVCPRCPCHPRHSPSSWERVPLSCETSSGKPGRGGGGIPINDQCAFYGPFYFITRNQIPTSSPQWHLTAICTVALKINN